MGPTAAAARPRRDLQIYAPDDTVKMKVSVSGVAACGKATLSPMMPGASAFAGQGGAGQTGIGGSSGSTASDGSGSTSTNGGGGPLKRLRSG